MCCYVSSLTTRLVDVLDVNPWRAMIKVPTDRRGRACRICLVPDGNEWNLNPNNVEGDLTAKKAARITLMDNSKWGEERVFYYL